MFELLQFITDFNKIHVFLIYLICIMSVLPVVMNGTKTTGSTNCLLDKNPPCGGRMQEMPMTTFM